MHFRIAFVAACAVRAAPLFAQTTPLTRADAVQSALDHGGRLAVARADTAVASAALLTARAYPNPSLSATYSKAVPSYHVIADLPIDFPYLRSPRIRAAEYGLQAAELRFELARATIALDADTTYTRAVAAQERLVLSTRNALDSDSLLHMVQRQREAGDASEMDVQLARVDAGQQENLAAADSLALVSALLDLQAVLGIRSERIAISVVDTLDLPPEPPPAAAMTLGEAAASLSLDSAAAAISVERRSLWFSPSLTGGIEWGDDTQRGILPTFGIGLGLPVLDRNRGPIAQARAEQVRASAALALAQLEVRNDLAHATRERANAMAKVRRDRSLAGVADTVATMSITAYREGASTLANILQARRSAREVRGQYVDDLSAAWIATAELRVLSLTPTKPVP